jgi:hypothetical protein
MLRPGSSPRVLFEAGYEHGLEAERPVILELLRRCRVKPAVAYSRTRMLGPADFADLAALGVPVLEAESVRHRRFECIVITDRPFTHSWRSRRRTLLHHGSAFGNLGQSYCIGLLRDGVYEFLLALNPLEAAAAGGLVRSPERQVMVVGQPKLDPLKSIATTAHERDPAVPPTILLSSHWTSESLHHNVVEGVLRCLSRRTDLRVIVSGHPHLWRPEHARNHGRDWQAILAPLVEAPHMTLVTDTRRTVDLMQEADLLIGDKSSATVEFATLGRPIVHYRHPNVQPQPPEFRELLHGATHGFTSAADFVPAFEAGLTSIGSPPSASQRELVEQCFPTLGEATRLAADAIESIAFTGAVPTSSALSLP